MELKDDLRTKIAQVIYGDGNVVSWAWSVATADILIWELGLCGTDEFNEWN